MVSIMPEVAYCIDKSLSEENRVLALSVEQVEKEGFHYHFLQKPLSLDLVSLKKRVHEKDFTLLKWLMEEEKKGSSKRSGSLSIKKPAHVIFIPYSQSIASLKQIASTGKLFLQQKHLVVNLLKKNTLSVLVESDSEGKIKLSSHIRCAQQEFDLRESSFICGGNPSWFIKGISLETFPEGIPWNLLKQLYTAPHEISNEELLELSQDDSGVLNVVFKGHSKEILQCNQNPTPILMLKDRTGAFADLWMDYGQGRLVDTKEQSSNKRQFAAERDWEKDLLETDFVRKEVNNSQYYCPLDKVAKSLAFLIEIGWKIHDWKGNHVLRHSGTTLSLQTAQEAFHMKGKIQYGEFEAELSHIAGCFNRRDRFVRLSSGAVGLLPDNWDKEGLSSLLQEGEIASDSIKINRTHLWVLTDALEGTSSLQLDESIKQFRENIDLFKGLEEVEAGENFTGILRPYQKQGLSWLHFLYQWGFHGLLADDMGLGKTVQVLAFLSKIEHPSPSLIVVPTSLIFNWQREIERFLPGYIVYIHHGPNRYQHVSQLPQKGVILTSYATLRLDQSLLSQLSFHCLILDEAQAIKNPQTQLFQTVKSMQARFRLSITGTPLENHLNELWAHFHFLLPHLLGNQEEFATEIQASESDARFLQRIKRKVRPFLLRRKKEEVAKDLPEKIEQTVWVEMSPSQRQIYDSFLAGFKGNLLKKIDSEGVGRHRLEIFEALLRLRQICCHPLLVSAQVEKTQTIDSAKLETLLIDIDMAISEKKKVLVYSQFTSMLKLIATEIKKRGYRYVYLDGSTQDREKVVLQFQEDPETLLFLISLKAGGVGLNLTAADYVLLYDPWWNEAAENQAINRAHRIGRRETVIAKRYVAIESIEEKIMKLKALKRSFSENFLEGDSSENLSIEELRFLLE